MINYRLSYIVATRNKLPFLKESMKYLLQHLKEDEEIIIIDGASEDGTVKYLSRLLKENKIHKLISEPDQGEAHALNKGLLASRGELIKIISDDDVFYYPRIKECRNFMLNHPEIDVLATEGGGTNLHLATPIGFTKYYKNFENWKKHKQPFSFCGLGLMLRKKSLPLIGLFNTNVVSVDAEYSLRLTSNNINFAWYTGYCWARIYNLGSNSHTQSDKIFSDIKKLENYYLGKKYNQTLFQLKKLGIKLKKRILKRTKNNTIDTSYSTEDIKNKFRSCYQKFEEKNLKIKPEFIFKISGRNI